MNSDSEKSPAIPCGLQENSKSRWRLTGRLYTGQNILLLYSSPILEAPPYKGMVFGG